MTSHPIRSDLRDAHETIRTHLASPGTWWTGEERLQIAAEVRVARRCGLCQERKGAVSPSAVTGRHETEGKLPPELVDLIHRLVTDPGRITKSYVHGLFTGGVVSDAPYVELVSVAVLTNALDVFDRAFDRAPAALPTAIDGSPSRIACDLAREDGAWVKLVPAGEAGGERAKEIYQGMERVPNIGRALSLVPAEVAVLHGLSEPHYMKLVNVRDPNYEAPGRAIDRMQMELVAARVSRMNDCFY